MLKVYNVYDYISIDGEKWRQVGRGGYRITDAELQHRILLDNASFDETREYLKNKVSDAMFNDKTFFRGRPLIKINYSDCWEYVTYRQFDTLSYKRVYKEWEHVTMKWLMEHASSNEVIQYLKERGITTCPMNL